MRVYASRVRDSGAGQANNRIKNDVDGRSEIRAPLWLFVAFVPDTLSTEDAHGRQNCPPIHSRLVLLVQLI